MTSAFVVPDVDTFEQIALEEPAQHDTASWWEKIPSKESVASSVGDAVDSLSAAFRNAAHKAEDRVHGVLDDVLESDADYLAEALDDDYLSEAIDDASHPHRGHGGHGV